jgi:hypothetical protein
MSMVSIYCNARLQLTCQEALALCAIVDTAITCSNGSPHQRGRVAYVVVGGIDSLVDCEGSANTKAAEAACSSHLQQLWQAPLQPKPERCAAACEDCHDETIE